MKTPSPTLSRWAVSLAFLLCGMLYATWAVNIPGVRDALHLTKAQIGLALLAVGVGSLCTMPLTGHWVARYGSHRVTAWTLSLSMLSVLPPFLAPNFWGLTLALLLLGAANGALDVAMNAQGVTVEKALERPVMSSLHANYSLGNVLGAGLGSLLIGRVPMLWHALGFAVVTLALALWAGRQLLPDPADTVSSEDTGPRGITLPTLMLGTLCLLGMFAEGANYDWATLYFRDELGVSLSQAGLGYAAFVAAMTIGRIFGDQVRARAGNLRVVRLGAALTTLGLALALLSHQPLLAGLGFVLSGLGLSNVVPVMYGEAGHALGGRGIAQVATIGYSGFLVGAPLIGLVAEHTSLRAALGLAAVAAGLVALLAGWAFGLIRHPASTIGT